MWIVSFFKSLIGNIGNVMTFINTPLGELTETFANTPIENVSIVTLLSVALPTCLLVFLVLHAIKLINPLS